MGELRLDLTPNQKVVFNDPHRFKVVVAGRRFGKTRLSVTSLLTKGLENPHKHAWTMYVAPTFGQAMDLTWNLLMDLGADVIEKWNVNDGEIRLITGTTLYIRGADNPDRLRGPGLWHVVLDEYKDMKVSVWESVIRPALSDYKGTGLFIGTPEPGESDFRKRFDMGQEEERFPDWKSWHFTTYDNPFIAKEEIEEAKATMSTFEFKKEFLASFDTPGSEIFKEEWLTYEDEPKDGDFYLTIDLAGFQDINAVGVTKAQKTSLDDTAICVVKVTEDGKWWVKKIEMGRWDVRENAVRILMAIRTYRPVAIGIEKGSLMRAVMPYLQDLMRKNNVYAHVEPVSIGSNSKENRVIYALQGMFEHGRISLNKKENWDKFRNQLLMFPSKRVHDDGPDALSLLEHLVKTTYGESDDSEEWEPLDIISGV